MSQGTRHIKERESYETNITVVLKFTSLACFPAVKCGRGNDLTLKERNIFTVITNVALTASP